MKILVTGSNGLLGQKLIHLLRSREAVEVLATSSGENRISANKGYTYRSLDVTSEAEVNTVIEEFKRNIIDGRAGKTYQKVYT